MNILYNIIPILLICTLLQFSDGVEARNRILSKEENFELDAQLKLLNKPSVKTIQTSDGDIYDCVDIYQQPAFDHPSLRNHTVNLEQMKHSPWSNKKPGGNVSSTNFVDMEFKDGVCPDGTVLIRRITKDDLVRQSLRVAGDDPNTRFAVLRTKNSPKRYAGAGGIVTFYRPTVKGMQYSAARFLLANGPESIEVGWRVDPVLHGDDKCHFYLHTKLRDSECFGVRCPGFVITAPNIDIEAAYNNVSIRGRFAKELVMSIHRESSGDWVFSGGVNNRKVGYWPRNIFANEGLAQLASYVEWGGEVYSPNGTPTPPMGSGQYPMKDPILDCVYYQMTVVDESGQVRDVTDVEPFIKKYGGYLVDDIGFPGGNAGHLMFFGGPGGRK